MKKVSITIAFSALPIYKTSVAKARNISGKVSVNFQSKAVTLTCLELYRSKISNSPPKLEVTTCRLNFLRNLLIEPYGHLQ
jgi:hypothetical protein